MNKKKAAKGMLAVSAATALTFIAVEEMYRHIFYRERRKWTYRFESKGHDEGYYRFRDEAAERLRHMRHEEFTIKSSRGADLKGFYYPCGAEGKRIVFIVHGYRSEHADTSGMFYDYYKSRGIDVFCCDHAAAGESGGDYIGFDVIETEDCLLWLDFLREHFGEDVQIILHGFSMGSATVMKMSSRCPENVKFIIADSGYRNARASLNHQVGPMYEPLRLINKAVAGYDLNDSDVTESLMKSTLPILFVHGQDDKLVPFENGPELYDMYGGEKDCFFPPRTKHIESMYTHPDEYASKIDAFIENYLSPDRE